MRPATDSSLPESLAFILILALVILALRLVAKILAPLLLRTLWRIYSRILASSRKRFGRALYETVALRFPRLVSQFGRRFSVKRFAGLPLTLLAAAALYATVLAVELTLDLMFEPEDLAGADRRIETGLQPFRSPALVAAFAWLTDLGNNATLVALSATATAFALISSRAVNVLPLWVTVLGAQIYTWAGKFALDRQRPEFLTDIVAHSPSFPSSHASGSLAIYGFIAYMLAREISSPARRFEVVFWIVVLIGLIGFSRIFLHVHYASDVAAGYLVGGFWLVIGISLAELRRARSSYG
ncbi:MAG: phosphatase PAP2 family protein [Gammaproteobacteria bacterium]|nr:phosphatase PAP2 family protein [Gammaproteobacteria bacterium]